MNQIEIKTSHNIVLSFGLAGVGKRVGAYLIDVVILYLFSLIFVLTFKDSFLMYIVLVPIWIFYDIISELYMNGQTVGKRILKIRVVSLNAKNLDLKSVLIRWAFRLIDITGTSGLLGIFMIVSSSRNQRIGDVLARTTVIDLAKKNFQSLKRLVALNDIDHVITYPQVAAYNDQDMLVLKDTLHRIGKSPSPEEVNFAKKLASKIDKELGILNRPTSLKQYFKVLVRDYVMLSR